MCPSVQESVATYFFLWYEAQEKWFYAMQPFDPANFPEGFAEYCVTVSGGLITDDTWNPTNVGKPFAECYSAALWEE